MKNIKNKLVLSSLIPSVAFVLLTSVVMTTLHAKPAAKCIREASDYMKIELQECRERVNKVQENMQIIKQNTEESLEESKKRMREKEKKASQQALTIQEYRQDLERLESRYESLQSRCDKMRADERDEIQRKYNDLLSEGAENVAKLEYCKRKNEELSWDYNLIKSEQETLLQSKLSAEEKNKALLEENLKLEKLSNGMEIWIRQQDERIKKLELNVQHLERKIKLLPYM